MLTGKTTRLAAVAAGLLLPLSLFVAGCTAHAGERQAGAVPKDLEERLVRVERELGIDPEQAEAPPPEATPPDLGEFTQFFGQEVRRFRQQIERLEEENRRLAEENTRLRRRIRELESQ